MKDGYNPTRIERYWQEVWQKSRIWEPDLEDAKNPFYNLMMFPYPSAEGLHVGNFYAFTGSDIYGRYKRMAGFDVFEPIGLDGFGIHSENYALKIDVHPVKLIRRTEKNFYRQLMAIGNSYDWSHKLQTYDPDYYRWTQWIFIQLFKAGLAYRTKSPVNFCPSCKTVLADEQVIHGPYPKGQLARDTSEVKRPSTSEVEELRIPVCERCRTPVEKKELEQWFFRITKYAQRLLDNLQQIDWSEKVKTVQANWIGKSEGFEIMFSSDIDNRSLITVFTTRPDTIYGVTFVALAPQHPLVTKIISKAKGKSQQEIRKFLDYSLKKLETGQLHGSADGLKSGVFTGFHCKNPISGKTVPLYIADYVLMEYGTGAVMGVPAHDQRDMDFSKKYHLDIVEVIRSPTLQSSSDGAQSGNQVVRSSGNQVVGYSAEAYEGEGILVNSDRFNGLFSKQAIKTIINYLERNHLAEPATRWHLRDWLISRQRYWGPPIPMIYCQKCAKSGKSWFTAKASQRSKVKGQKSKGWNAAGWYPVAEEELPVKLPYIENFKPTGSGVSPLAQDPSFVSVTCPVCGAAARRETDVSDTFLDSAWYFLRYPSVKKPKVNLPWDPKITRRWLPADMYIGGAEHAVLHLMYSRFLTMVFADLGLLEFDEPFSKFRAHGLLIAAGSKMSKSRGNIVNPDDYIDKYGADSLRCYLMFCGRFIQGGDFRDTGIAGMQRFLKRVWRLVIGAGSVSRFPSTATRQDGEAVHMMHKTVKKVTDDIENLSYNTAIAAIMGYVNFLEEKIVHSSQSEVHSKTKTMNHEPLTINELETLLLLLAPFAPHMTEELWQRVKYKEFSIKYHGKVREKIHNSKYMIQNSIHVASWPKYDPKLAEPKMIELVVQINGKLRAKFAVEPGISRGQAINLALSSIKVKKYLTGKKTKRVIFVPARLVNFVV